MASDFRAGSFVKYIEFRVQVDCDQNLELHLIHWVLVKGYNHRRMLLARIYVIAIYGLQEVNEELQRFYHNLDEV